MSGSAAQRIFFLTALLIAGLSTSWAYHKFQSGWVYFRKAENSLARGDPAKAGQDLRQALASGPGSLRVGAELARVLTMQGRTREAEEIYRGLVEENSGDPAALNLLVNLLDASGRPVEALAVLESHQDLWSDDQAFRLRLADLYRRSGRFEPAEEIYSRLSVGKDGSAKARYLWAETLAWQGKLDQAQVLLQELLKETPDNRRARLALARILSREGRLEEAARQYRIYLGEAEPAEGTGKGG